MMQRNMQADLRQSFALLHQARFPEAQSAAAPWRPHKAAELLHALATAAAEGPEAAAARLAAIARANPAARHPVLDLVGVLPDPATHAPHLEAALRHTPDDPVLHTELGQSHATTGSIHAAIDAFAAAVRLAPSAATWSNLAKARAAASLPSDDAFATALRLAPDNPQLRLNHAIALLRAGDWARGWPLFRARHALPGHAPPPPGPELLHLDQAPGRTILLLHDEGFGDTIQFIRYAPLLAATGARLLAALPPPLTRLIATVPGLTPAGPRPAYDLWARIPNLPALFATTPDTIPAPSPYLHADPTLAATWSLRLPPGRRIGLAWAGASRAHDPAAAATDRLRSIPPARLAPLLATPGITWISLQKDHPAPPPLFDPMPHAHDFADTAAIIANLDTVVSVDTAVAHLAAALGKPTLLLDRFDNCWRWLAARSTTPWYPTVQILRQPTPGDWETPLREAADLLSR